MYLLKRLDGDGLALCKSYGKSIYNLRTNMIDPVEDTVRTKSTNPNELMFYKWFIYVQK